MGKYRGRVLAGLWVAGLVILARPVSLEVTRWLLAAGYSAQAVEDYSSLFGVLFILIGFICGAWVYQVMFKRQ